MTAASHATARIMETWAHGEDVADALGIARAPTNRLRHIAHLGVRARPYAFHLHGLSPPSSPIHVALSAPDGSAWTWDDPGAVDRVAGSALDFCRVVTRRTHIDDTGLLVIGLRATQWMQIAQAYAGPPGSGRTARNDVAGRQT
jgi:uncharacterized protein (TIGR03084 family)